MNNVVELAGNKAENIEIKGRSLWQDAWSRLKKNRAALVCAVILFIITMLAIFVPMEGIAPHAYDDTNNFQHVSEPPNFEKGYYFGTDTVGRDLFVRVFYGARISLMVGVLATFVSLLIGITYGAMSGYIGGRTDMIMMRIVDILYSLPFMFFVILLMVYVGRNIFLIFIALGAVEWLDMARIVRGQTLSVKRKEYIEAAEASGVNTLKILFRHVIPNCLGPVIVYVTLLIPKVILVESFLSFLGLGVPEPKTSWGKLISEGAKQIESFPWMLVFPAFFLAVTLFCFNFIGDGLRDALDPKDR